MKKSQAGRMKKTTTTHTHTLCPDDSNDSKDAFLFCVFYHHGLHFCHFDWNGFKPRMNCQTESCENMPSQSHQESGIVSVCHSPGWTKKKKKTLTFFVFLIEHQLRCKFKMIMAVKWVFVCLTHLTRLTSSPRTASIFIVFQNQNEGGSYWPFQVSEERAKWLCADINSSNQESWSCEVMTKSNLK